MAILELKQLTMRFGGLTAVSEVNLRVQPGEILSVIGPNGAGKTTLFNAITGIYEPTGGEVLFEGRALRNSFSGRAAFNLAAVALVTAVLVTVALHIEPLWQAGVTANYLPGQRFSYGKATGDALGLLAARWRTVLPTALFSAALGAVGAFVVWQRRRLSPETISQRGICRTFQNIRLFRDMTVLENVQVGLDRHLRSRFWHMALRLPLFHRDEANSRRRAHEWLEFVGLSARSNHLAKNLPYGDQRRLEIARALATSPRLLLLDEPAAGMNPAESAELMRLIRRVRERSITVLLIEHHMKLVMDISDRIAVLNYGAKIAEGTPAEVRANPAVIEAYLGRENSP